MNVNELKNKDLYFLHLIIKYRNSDEFKFTQEDFSYNELKLNSTNNTLYFHLRIRKILKSIEMVDLYSNSKLTAAEVLFYDVYNKKKIIIPFDNITLSNRGSYYEATLKVNSKYAKFLNNVF